ncbi:MAG: MgtC/SapB family protein [Methylophaga sp.]|uniref:MgtC/SapB family protein n=1 Tax=Methylophaga sp. TaxID=2024840 RepID=UPI00299D964B|nr:MgtC/SapB family protein [Methylophaga sp.]MDX1751460.1 MgtC/SapB family protein [Methylophaga sp.]
MYQLSDFLGSVSQDLFALGIALALGALIGLQRGWLARDKAAGQRVAGIRTHALLGLLGGLSVQLGRELGNWVPAILLVMVALAGLAGFLMQNRQQQDFSITSWVGQVLTFCFGALVVAGQPVIAAAAAVVTATILDNKESIHRFLKTLEANELDAGLKLLLISVVVLPLLPNEGFGPGDVLNPREIWWLVVLIAAIGFIGYFAMRFGGSARGIMFTSLFAGLSSSTALTLHFSRLSRQSNSRQLSPLLAAGILIACGTMFPRILLYAALIYPPLLKELLIPVIVMGGFLYGSAALIWWQHSGSVNVSQPQGQNPLELRSALLFGLLLVVILLLGEWLKNVMGDAGVFLLAAISGLTDVDAITLSLTRMAREDLMAATAVLAIIIAAMVNNLFKASLALGIGTVGLGIRVLIPMLLSLSSGLAVVFLRM